MIRCGFVLTVTCRPMSSVKMRLAEEGVPSFGTEQERLRHSASHITKGVARCSSGQRIKRKALDGRTLRSKAYKRKENNRVRESTVRTKCSREPMPRSFIRRAIESSNFSGRSPDSAQCRGNNGNLLAVTQWLRCLKATALQNSDLSLTVAVTVRASHPLPYYLERAFKHLKIMQRTCIEGCNLARSPQAVNFGF